MAKAKIVAHVVDPEVFSLVGHAEFAGPTGGTTPPVDMTNATLLVMSVACFDGGNTLVVGDSMGNAWQLIDVEGTASVTKLFYAANPTTDVAQQFTAVNAQFITICVAGFSGIALANPLDQVTGVQTTSSTGINPGELSATVPNELFVSSYETERPGVISVSDSFIITDATTFSSGQHFGGALAYKVSSDTENPLWGTGGIAGRESAIMATFIPIRQGGGPGQPAPSIPLLLNNGWLAGTPVPSSCSVGISPDFYDTAARTLYSCVAGRYVVAAPPVLPLTLSREIFSKLPVHPNNASALKAGLTKGMPYRTNGDPAVVAVVK